MQNDLHPDREPVTVYDTASAAKRRYGPFCFVRAFWTHRYILQKLIGHELNRRYRGSVLGYGWAVLIPLTLLAIFTIIFTVVFEARWSADTGDTQSFALLLFIGLICFNFLTECMNRSPSLLRQNMSLIKKVFFPVEILPVQIVAVALVNFAIGFALLLVAYLAMRGLPPATVFLLPLVLLPLLLFGLATSWAFSAIGVFLRDLEQVTPVLSMLLLFLSAVFYPIDRLDGALQTIVRLNPLATIIESARRVVFFGQSPDWTWLAAYLLVSWALAWLAFVLFSEGRRRFADIL